MSIRCLFGCKHEVAYQGFIRTVRQIVNYPKPLPGHDYLIGVPWHSLETREIPFDKIVSYCERCESKRFYDNKDDCPIPIIEGDEKGMLIYKDDYVYKDYMRS